MLRDMPHRAWGLYLRHAQAPIRGCRWGTRSVRETRPFAIGAPPGKPPMSTSKSTSIPTPEAAAPQKRSRGSITALVALMGVVVAVATVAWVCALVVLAG